MIRRGIMAQASHIIAGAGALATLALAACGQDTATASLRALDASGEVSVLCLARDENGAFTRGVDRFECPDLVNASNSPDQKRLHALVTQPITGEVALVDLAVSANSAVVDFEPSQPGFSFMPIGSEPGAIVSTQGGVASFVAVREVGREGLFALPSSCIAPRPEGAPLRDIRTWPACRLPAAPGPMVLLEDPAVDRDGDPATPPEVRARCDADYLPAGDLIGVAPAASRELCPADLAVETRTSGRQKLAVALPSLSEIWVVDAQELLDRAPGSFDPCTYERRLELEATLPMSAQQLPADLAPAAPECLPVGFDHGPAPASFRPAPSDFALDDDGRLYVADSEAPAVHVLDASSPCELSTLSPLEPMSFTAPGAVITTRRVAVSPLTPFGKRFVYAVDNSATSTAGSLMAFDVSPGSTQRTPIVRERSSNNPGDPPDRITLGRDVADVEFVFHDFPQPESGAAVEGVECDPHPSVPFDAPEALYRPRADLSSGANPSRLRGTFAFAALHSGQVAVIDVEDLDAACRRPISVQHSSSEDIFGCENDDPTVPEDQGYRVGGIPTVTGELSCNIVAPHRARSRTFFTNSGGTGRSAALLSFPTLTLDTGRSVTTDQSDDGRDQPKLLAARHAADRQAQLYVGPLLYSTYDPARPNEDPSNRLEVDPGRAERNSLLFSFEEPRAFSPNEDYTATYEGVVRATSQALLKVDSERGLGIIDEGLNASFCVSGVQDAELTRGVGTSLGVAAADLAAFARRHADYVHLTGDLPEPDDEHFHPGNAGDQCGRGLFASSAEGPARVDGHTLCEQFFGPPEVPTQWRDLRIVEAGEDRLRVEPRPFDPNTSSPERRRHLMEFVSCCFPFTTDFQIRAGHQWVVRGSATGVPHRVTTDPETQRCVSDCSPLVAKQAGRAFELSCAEGCATDAEGRPSVGPAVPGQDFACIVDTEPENGIDPGEDGSECVFQSLTTRFAIYRGQQPSARDMRFRWQLSDGFTPLTIPLTNNVDRTRSSPRSLSFIPETNQVVVSDGSARGVTFFTPRNPGRTTSIF